MDDITESDIRRRDFRLVRTQRVLQIILGLFWLLDAGLQFQPYMFGSGFTTTYLLNNAHNQPDVIRWIITNVGNFVGPHVAVWNTFFALIQVAIGLGLLFRRTVRPALVLSFFWAFGVWFFGEGLGQIFTGSASALTGAPGFGVPLRTHRPDGLAPVGSGGGRRGDRRAGRYRVLRRGTRHRRSDDTAAGVVRLLVAGGDPVPAPGQPDPDVGVERDHRHVGGRAERVLPLSQQLRQPFRQRRRVDHVVAGHRFAHRRVRTTRVPPTDSVPGRRWPVGHLLLGQRSGSRRHLHRLGHRPQLRPPHRAPGSGHGAGRAAGPGDLALPVLDRALSISGAGAGGRGGTGGRPVPQRRLSGRRPGIDEHGHGRHDRDVPAPGRQRLGRADRRPQRLPARVGTTARPERAWT